MHQTVAGGSLGDVHPEVAAVQAGLDGLALDQAKVTQALKGVFRANAGSSPHNTSAQKRLLNVDVLTPNNVEHATTAALPGTMSVH